MWFGLYGVFFPHFVIFLSQLFTIVHIGYNMHNLHTRLYFYMPFRYNNINLSFVSLYPLLIPTFTCNTMSSAFSSLTSLASCLHSRFQVCEYSSQTLSASFDHPPIPTYIRTLYLIGWVSGPFDCRYDYALMTHNTKAVTSQYNITQAN